MIPLLLLQAAAVEASLHPYLTWTLIAALFTALVAIIKVLLSFFEKRVNEKFAEVEAHNTKQDGRLDLIEGDIRKYDTHVAVGAKESSEIHSAVGRVEAALNSHIVKEEGTTWAKLDRLVEALATMQTSNEVAHASLVAGQTVLGNRVEAVEKKMPNGELQKLADAFVALSKARAGSRVRGKK
jgi:hypothetical protein